MSRDEMIAFLMENPLKRVTHDLFSPEEYIYANERGEVYEENGYLFEDWNGSDYSAHNGLRIRKGGRWEFGWRVLPDDKLEVK